MNRVSEEIQSLKGLFRERTPSLLNPGAISGSLVRAAVILPLVPSAKGLEILFTLRSDEVKDHKGQISFPGGVIEETDRSPLFAAMRETSEELGIGVGAIEIIGELDSYITVTGYHIAAFLGILDGGCDFKPHQREIREVFSIPVADFLKPELPERLNFVHEGLEREVFIYNLRGRMIWGATARILKNFFDITGGKLI
ncbi:MAG: CoA pyrophosphatase [Deltaproteobacteria bacterium]|nr:CoA pyrophosphatase [Deltaproteobacteria bacterium]